MIKLVVQSEKEKEQAFLGISCYFSVVFFLHLKRVVSWNFENKREPKIIKKNKKREARKKGRIENNQKVKL